MYSLEFHRNKYLLEAATYSLPTYNSVASDAQRQTHRNEEEGVPAFVFADVRGVSSLTALLPATPSIRSRKSRILSQCHVGSWDVESYEMASKEIQDTRQLYLWLMGCMYMFAFGSLYVQIPGMLKNTKYEYH